MQWLKSAKAILVVALNLVRAREAVRAADPNRSPESRAHSASLLQQLELLESALLLGESSFEQAQQRSETGNRFTIDG